jgi:steroid delta-isomerase-like uncharacterized protein
MSDAKQLAERGWDSWFRHDLEGLMEFYADDSELIMPGSPPIKGKEAIRGVLQMYMAAFPDERPIEIRHMADGNVAITEWKSVSTHSGPLPMPNGEMLPATGKSVTTAGVTITDIEGGKAKRQTFYFDQVEFMQQLGLMPEAQAQPAKV